MPFGIGSGEGASDQTGKKLTVVRERCPQSHHCPSVRICPVGALRQEGFSAPMVDLEICIRCGKCVKACPKKVLVLE